MVFCAVTFPTNKKTKNWTAPSVGWESLRRRWEYSHAAGAILHLVALALLCLSVLSER
jgi:hypothetical protein